MSNLTLILLAAGTSSRFGTDVKKQWLRIDHKPLWLFVADKFYNTSLFDKIIITASSQDVTLMQNYTSHYVVAGGETRQKSLQNALEFVHSDHVIVSDIARACVSESTLKTMLRCKDDADCIVPYLKVTDTIVYENTTIDREQVKRIQTPQLSNVTALKNALVTQNIYTDESSAIVANGGTRAFIQGEEDAHKITFMHDLNKIPCLQKPSSDILSGNGFDVHAFSTDGEMVLCGVKIDSSFGFIAHSDGDVAIHALIDALLGAAGMGDIGMMFPDNDPQYENADSKKLLKQVVSILKNTGYVIVNADITIAAQKPKIGPYKSAMRETLASILEIDPSRINVKATTTEKLGFIGREEGVGVIANANLKYFDWTEL